MTQNKPPKPTGTRHVIGDSIFPPFPVKSPVPTGTAAPGSKPSTSQTTASGSGKKKLNE
ncbi:hypothetical protein MCBMB27_00918 [Methylobacterium phyllosphaerae]|uniref:Uncharacterized protein n=1 Tax=Methylobacterium phyllosphaerae TaxID=418223 RepID=A0AAE8L9V6_9HYPH|nr:MULTISPECIES: hypothetical protein [Methylobacterium]APT30209.1 hypothetical protein MCBMB27_00918 [Methylobacterium phyllosphaerae]SFH76218.1 hypothetical protein SAMN05192567_1586 [Methylobacterium phyllosphaerae]